MKISSEAPRLPALPFVVADIVLLVIAALIGWHSPAPLGVAPLAAISFCVGLAAVAGLLPLVINFNRAQEEALQDRANQIEALARTVSATADQVSIAASNLPATAATIAQQLEAAKALPSVLQSQLKDAHAQLAATAAAENTALREEVSTLRRELAGARENDPSRLTAALSGISRVTSQLSAFEALATQQAEALARLPIQAAESTRLMIEALEKTTSDALSRIDAAAAQNRAAFEAAASVAGEALTASLDQVTAASIARIVVASTQNHATLEAASAAASGALTASLDEAAARHLAAFNAASARTADDSRATLTAAFESFLADAAAKLAAISAISAIPAAPPSPAPELTVFHPSILADAPQALPPPATKVLPTANQPLIDNAVLEPLAAWTDEVAGSTDVAAAVGPESTSEAEPEPKPAPESEAERAPVDLPLNLPVVTVVVVPPPPPPPPSPATALAPAGPEPEPGESEAEASPVNDSDSSPSAPSEPALSSDGLTRLIATAYIGIGNRLFIRGDGPGLSLKKGVPLQFVSIGKWRWENPEMLFPATVRLYKNDQIECTSLGEFTLEPGHHHEVTATF